MNTFQSTFYNITHVKKNNEFEKSFQDFKIKVELYEKQYSLTLKSYVKEWNLELANAREDHQKEYDAASKIYDKVLKESGEDEYAESYALQASGLEYIDNHLHEIEERINNKYKDFLDLYSKSIMIALYSINESKLKQLCEISSEKFDKKIKPSHFNSRDYLISSMTYLNLVIEVSIDNLDKYISKLKDIQFLRNKIIHTDSIFVDKTINEIVERNKKSLYLNPDNNYLKIINSKFIKELFKLYKEFYEELIWLVDSRQKNEIIKNGLEFWFGLMDRNIFITNLKCEKLPKGKRSLVFNVSSRKKDIPKFECKIIIEYSKKKSIEIIDQTTSKTVNEFSTNRIQSKGYYLRKIFDIFELSEKDTAIKVMMY